MNTHHTQPTHAELITLDGDDVYTELQSIEDIVLSTMTACERCGDWVDVSTLSALGICEHCHDQITLDAYDYYGD